jgi:hypothetical protein
VAEGAARRQAQQLASGSSVDGPTAADDATVNQDVGKETGEAKDAVVLIEQTSYIDAERLAARDAVRDEANQGGQAAEQARSVKEERLVDVSAHVDLALCINDFWDSHTDDRIYSGGPQRHVSTLAPNTWLLHPQLK